MYAPSVALLTRRANSPPDASFPRASYEQRAFWMTAPVSPALVLTIARGVCYAWPNLKVVIPPTCYASDLMALYHLGRQVDGRLGQDARHAVA